LQFRIQYIILSLLCIFLLSGCDSSESTRPVEDAPFAIESVLPAAPRVGEPLRIVFARSVPGYQVSTLMFNGLWSYADSVRQDTVYTFCPLVPHTDVLTLLVPTVVVTDSGAVCFNTETPISVQKVYGDGLHVMSHDEAPVTPAEAIAPWMGHAAGWQAEVSQDTVRLWVRVDWHDEGHVELALRFLDGGEGALPTLIDYLQIYRDYPPGGTVVERVDTLRNGVFKIDAWREHGVISGKAYAELEPWESRSSFPPKIVFYVKTE